MKKRSLWNLMIRRIIRFLKDLTSHFFLTWIGLYIYIFHVALMKTRSHSPMKSSLIHFLKSMSQKRFPAFLFRNTCLRNSLKFFLIVWANSNIKAADVARTNVKNALKIKNAFNIFKIEDFFLEIKTEAVAFIHSD